MNRSIKTLATSTAAFAAGWLLPLIALANEEAAEHGAEHAEHGWNTTALLASGVNFLILVSLFVWLFRDAVSKALKSRRAEIETQLNEAAKLKAEAEAKHKEYSDRMARLDQELAQIRKDMISAGEKERDRIVADAEHKASRMRKEAQFLIEQQMKQLRSDLTRDTVEAAIAAAEQLLVKATTSYDQQRIAQEYLASLDQNAKSNTSASQAPQQESRV